MPVAQKQKMCRNCGRKTLFQKDRFSFGWGCLLSILTGGLFLIVWVLLEFLDIFRPYRCQTCGRKG